MSAADRDTRQPHALPPFSWPRFALLLVLIATPSLTAGWLYVEKVRGARPSQATAPRQTPEVAVAPVRAVPVMSDPPPAQTADDPAPAKTVPQPARAPAPAVIQAGHLAPAEPGSAPPTLPLFLPPIAP